MDATEREILIGRHTFYVAEGRTRLLAQFSDIGGEADAFAAKWLEDNAHRFDPERHDPSDFPQMAFDESCYFHELLTDMHRDTKFAIISGMFHNWEKSVRDWLDKEMWGWSPREIVRKNLWRSNFVQLGGFLEFLGWQVMKTSTWKSLDRCRLVVNVYKHGSGGSEVDLKEEYPEFFEDKLGLISDDDFGSLVNYRHLQVTDVHFEEFDRAICEFWKEFPSQIFRSDLVGEPPERLKISAIS